MVANFPGLRIATRVPPLTHAARRTCEGALSTFFSGLWRKLGATARRKVTDRSESDASVTFQRAMAVDAATLEKETLQWQLTQLHPKKKSHNGRRRGHIDKKKSHNDKRNLTMATVCLAMGVVRLAMALEIAQWLWKREHGSWKLNYSNFTFKLRGCPDFCVSRGSSKLEDPWD